MQMVTAGIDGDDHPVVVGTDTKQFHNMTMQLDVEAQQWSGWNPFVAGGPVWIALDYNADGRLTFFSHNLTANYGGLYCMSQVAFDSTEWDLGWTELAANGIHDYTVVRDLTPPAG